MLNSPSPDPVAEATQGRTLANYRPQHDHGCDVHYCGQQWEGPNYFGVCRQPEHCDIHYIGTPDSHPFVKRACSCGLDTLLQAVSSSQAGARGEIECDEAAKPEVGPMQDAESLSGVQTLGSSGLALAIKDITDLRDAARNYESSRLDDDLRILWRGKAIGYETVLGRLARVRASPVSGAWQPIETVKPNTFVLLNWPRMNPEHACIGILSESSFDVDGRFVPSEGAPVQWQPLPPLPSPPPEVK